MDLGVREARIFKYGSGTGTNFSALRGEGEPLSGGGKSSGLMSFLKIGDRAAGAIKSGGTTRRAAKMVVLDLDHPDIEDFIGWKVVEEQKVAALVAGSKLLNRHLNAILKACQAPSPAAPLFPNEKDWQERERFDRAKNSELRKAIAEAQADLIAANYIERTIQLARQGFTALRIEEYDTDWNSKAYYTVSGQNSNNSVRVTNEFMRAVENDGSWKLYWRTELEKARKEERSASARKALKARELWDQITNAAWSCTAAGSRRQVRTSTACICHRRSTHVWSRHLRPRHRMSAATHGGSPAAAADMPRFPLHYRARFRYDSTVGTAVEAGVCRSKKSESIPCLASSGRSSESQTSYWRATKSWDRRLISTSCSSGDIPSGGVSCGSSLS